MNICIFSGRLVADAEQRFTQSGTSVSNFALAVDSGFGEYKRTDFPKFVLWKRDNLIPHLTKGKALTVTAELQERKFQDKEGNNRKAIEFVVRDLEFQKGGNGSQSAQSAQPSNQPGPAQESWSNDDSPF